VAAVVGRQPDGRLVPDVRPLLAVSVSPGGLPAIRTRVETIARGCGLSAERASDWVTAVNELMANAVRHGGGTGELRMWLDGDLFCEVRDDGPGFVAGPYTERGSRPAPSGDGGMGLWIARQMTDGLEIDSGRSGTVVRIRTRTHGGG
jgi:anti-sigma regulatory factor (Ser/Thr protein kinase)